MPNITREGPTISQFDIAQFHSLAEQLSLIQDILVGHVFVRLFSLILGDAVIRHHFDVFANERVPPAR